MSARDRRRECPKALLCWSVREVVLKSSGFESVSGPGGAKPSHEWSDQLHTPSTQLDPAPQSGVTSQGEPRLFSWHLPAVQCAPGPQSGVVSQARPGSFE
jgi:hypothetical protein